jgi:hypothetical protein
MEVGIVPLDERVPCLLSAGYLAFVQEFELVTKTRMRGWALHLGARAPGASRRCN